MMDCVAVINKSSAREQGWQIRISQRSNSGIVLSLYRKQMIAFSKHDELFALTYEL
jgi:hypothetical protein